MKLSNAPTPAPERIRLARLQQGLSQENMADLLHLSTTAYGDIERGKTELTISRLAQIAAVLGTSVVALLSDESAEAAPALPIMTDLTHLQEIIDRQQLEIDKLRLEVEHYKRRYDDRVAMDLLRALHVPGMDVPKPERERIGF